MNRHSNLSLTITIFIIGAIFTTTNATSTKDLKYSKDINSNNDDDEDTGRDDNDDVTSAIMDLPKRKWSSKDMGMWGRKRSDPELPSKREWSSNKMPMWGRKKRSSIGQDNNDDDDYLDRSANDYTNDDVMMNKRKWTSNNMGMWGKKRSKITQDVSHRPFPVYLTPDHKRKWINAKSWIGQPVQQQRRSKWGSGKMMMWGKRSYIGQDNSYDDGGYEIFNDDDDVRSNERY